MEPANAPIPPEPTPPTTKAYRVLATLDAEDGVVDSTVELFYSYERYIGEQPEQLFVEVDSWTGDNIASIPFDGVLNVDTNDSVTGAHGADEPVQVGVLDVMLPFSPKISDVTIADEDGVPLGNISLADAVRVFCKFNPADQDCAEGFDLEITEMTAEISETSLVGELVPIAVRTVVVNNGPTSDVPATLDVALANGGSLTISPSTDAVSDSVDVGTPWVRVSEFTAECSDSGTGAVTFDGAVAQDTDERVELNLTNNESTASVEYECLLPVAINVRPGVSHNRVNAGEGRVSFAILTTDVAGYDLPLAFDAAWVDPASIIVAPREQALAGDGAGLSSTARLRDQRERFDERTRDGDLDLLAWFKADESGLTIDGGELCVVGTFERSDGTGGRFIGCDSAQLVPLGPDSRSAKRVSG